jgi:hypothetical protein
VIPDGIWQTTIVTVWLITVATIPSNLTEGSTVPKALPLIVISLVLKLATALTIVGTGGEPASESCACTT